MEENSASDQSSTVHDDNVFFKQMLDYIPVKFYFQKNAHDLFTKKENESEEEQGQEDPPKGKPKKKKRFKEPLDPVEQRKKKKARFDPSIPQTVTQVQERLLQAEKEVAAPNDNASNEKERKKKKTEETDDVSSVRSGTDSLEDLRERIQARINELKGKRKALGKMESVEKKRIKRRQSKMELKLRRKAERKNKMKDQAGPDRQMNGLAKASSKGYPAKPVFNKDGKMVFSKFDFSGSGEAKRKTDLPTGKDYKRLLEKVSKKKELLNEVRKTDKEKAKEMEQQDAWKSALAKAEGIKVKDNPELLKKAIKRKEGKKAKSGKSWEDKTEALDTKMKERQVKRKKNLQTRRKGKVDKKLKKMKKKGHIIPGF